MNKDYLTMNLTILTLTEKRSKRQQYTDPTVIFKQAALHLRITSKNQLVR